MTTVLAPIEPESNPLVAIRDLFVLSSLCFLCFFFRLGAVGLFDYNEGLYVEAAREMYVRGDSVTPRVNGLPFFDKPPLAYWLDGLSFRFFGINELAARFPVAVAAALLVFLTYGFGCRFLGRRAGLLAACALALNPLFFGTARQMTMDIHQTLWFAVGMMCFFRGYVASKPRQTLWYAGFWMSCGLGCLAKSVPGLIPIVAALVFVAVDRRFNWATVLQRMRDSKPLMGLLVLGAVVLPWHYLAYRANGPIFWQEYFWHHHVRLLTGQEFGHVQPIWYYVPTLIVGFFPWSIFALSAFPSAMSSISPWTAASQTNQIKASATTLLLVWTAVVFVLFTLMVSKVPSYLLLLYPAAALLVGNWLDGAIAKHREQGLRHGSAGIAIIAGLSLASVLYAIRAIQGTPVSASLNRAIPEPVMHWAISGLTLTVAGCLLAAALIWRGRQRSGIAVLIGTSLAFVTLSVTQGLSVMDRTLTGPFQNLARQASEEIREGVPFAIYCSGPWRPSAYFYLPDELFKDPQQQAPVVSYGDKIFEVGSFLHNHQVACVLTDSSHASTLLGLAPDLTIERREGRWLLMISEAELKAERESNAPDQVRIREASLEQHRD